MNILNLFQAVRRWLRRQRRRVAPIQRTVEPSIKIYQSLKGLPFPHRIQRNEPTILPQLKQTVCYAAVEQTSIEQAAEGLVPLRGDSLRYHLRKLSLAEVETVGHEALQQQAHQLLRRQQALQSPCTVAVDTTEYPYYGQDRGPFIHQTPEGWTRRYLSLATVGDRRLGAGLPLAVLPVSVLATKEQLVERALANMASLALSVKVLYADRGFYSVSVVRCLQTQEVPFVIRAKRTSRVKQVLADCQKTARCTVSPIL